MKKYVIQLSCSLAIPYLVGKVFNLQDEDNPIFNAQNDSNIPSYEKLILGPIIEELIFRIIPCGYVKLFSGNQHIINSALLIQGVLNFGYKHIPVGKSLILKSYYFAYATSAGLILSNIYRENSFIASIPISIGIHSLHNIGCDLLYILDKYIA